MNVQWFSTFILFSGLIISFYRPFVIYYLILVCMFRLYTGMYARSKILEEPEENRPILLFNYMAMLFIGFAQILILNLYHKKYNFYIVAINVLILYISVLNKIIGIENTL